MKEELINDSQTLESKGCRIPCLGTSISPLVAVDSCSHSCAYRWSHTMKIQLVAPGSMAPVLALSVVAINILRSWLELQGVRQQD